MSSILERSLAILEILADQPQGMSISGLAQRLDQPASGIHRTLNEFLRLGYVRQLQSQGDYALTLKLPALGLGFLGRAGVADVAQPVLDHLAADTRELVRLSVIDRDRLIWVGVAQGATGGLRYDPAREQGGVVPLASSAGGLAWLSSMADDEALGRVSAQGLPLAEAGPKAPRSLSEVLAQIAATRARGYAMAVDSFMIGMAAIAVPVCYRGDGPVIGCLSVAGPTVRMTQDEMTAVAPRLLAAAAQIGAAAAGSAFFQARHAVALPHDSRFTA